MLFTHKNQINIIPECLHEERCFCLKSDHAIIINLDRYTSKQFSLSSLSLVFFKNEQQFSIKTDIRYS